MKKCLIILFLGTVMFVSCLSAMERKFEQGYEKMKSRMEEFADWYVQQAFNVASFRDVDLNANTIFIFDMYEMKKLEYMGDSIQYTIMKDFYDDMCVHNGMDKGEFVQKLMDNSYRMKAKVGSAIDTKNELYANAYQYMADIIRINGPIKQMDRAEKRAERDFPQGKWDMTFLDEGLEKYLNSIRSSRESMNNTY